MAHTLRFSSNSNLNARLYLSLGYSHACRFGINSLIGEPETRVYMLDKTYGVSILDLWSSHAIKISLASVELFLQTKSFCYMYQKLLVYELMTAALEKS